MSREGRDCMREVAVALANWNGMKYIGRCLESILAQTWKPTRIVVVDNGSSDGSREWIQEHFPQVLLLRNESNRGFAVGYNQAIHACESSYILILNTDVFLASDFVENALRGFDQSPDTGAVTGLIYQESTKEWLNGGFFLRRQMRISHSRNTEEREEIFGCTGAVMLCRREMLEAVELDGEFFDETYFSYGEDIDLAWRAQLGGWKARYQPQARGYHIGSGSLEGNQRFIEKPAFFQRHLLKNRYLTVLKNASPGVLLYLLPSFLLTEPLVWLYLLMRRPLHFPYLLLALADVLSLLPQTLGKRRRIQRQSRVSSAYIRQFFCGF